MVNTGCREQEVCLLRWDYEVEMPELGISVFLRRGQTRAGDRASDERADDDHSSEGGIKSRSGTKVAQNRKRRGSGRYAICT